MPVVARRPRCGKSAATAGAALGWGMGAGGCGGAHRALPDKQIIAQAIQRAAVQLKANRVDEPIDALDGIVLHIAVVIAVDGVVFMLLSVQRTSFVAGS